MRRASGWGHPEFSRRVALQAGAVGLLGLATEHLPLLRAEGGAPSRSVIYVFLSGGLAQHDSFDLKPQAAAEIRGEFTPIATQTPGVQICEHLPKLAACSSLWSLVRSLTHSTNDHSAAHLFMLTGRSVTPPGFNPSKPALSDWPSIASVAGAVVPARNNLPPAIVLPERLIHTTGRHIPGQYAGAMGTHRDPWFVEASPFDARSYGAYPEFGFDHQQRPHQAATRAFGVASLSLPENFAFDRLQRRTGLLDVIDGQRRDLDQSAATGAFSRCREAAMSLLTDRRTRAAFDLANMPAEKLDRYGRNSFGWSLLMARQLVESGTPLVQVNLGNNETWDTHGNAFPHLRDLLFPPFDRALSALLTDLHESRLLDSTLVVVAGEFGRTPKVTGLPQFYKLPGRDHWGAVQSVLLAGGGVQGGRVIGSTDAIGAYPATDPQTPENLAATIYNSLGIPPEGVWKDDLDRPHAVYYGEPIRGLA
jgi:hypothetical protein